MMRTVNNDILLEIFLKTEIQHIPQWLRITKGKLAAAAVLEVITVAILAYGLSTHVFSAISGNFILLVLILAAMAIPVWAFAAFRREKEAYQEATHQAYANRERFENIVRSYMALKNSNDTPSNMLSSRLEHCPVCGFITVSNNRTCMTCNARLRR